MQKRDALLAQVHGQSAYMPASLWSLRNTDEQTFQGLPGSPKAHAWYPRAEPNTTSCQSWATTFGTRLSCPSLA
jgi:hypothetical protein